MVQQRIPAFAGMTGKSVYFRVLVYKVSKKVKGSFHALHRPNIFSHAHVRL
jgi:hypothetical protein